MTDGNESVTRREMDVRVEAQRLQNEGLRSEVKALRDLFELARQADKEAISLALDAADRAVNKADLANEKRLDILNHVRDERRDEGTNYARKEVMDLLSTRVASIEGRFLGLTVAGTVIGIAGAVYTLVK